MCEQNDSYLVRPLSEEDAELYARCVRCVSEKGKATPALLQRNFRLSYAKAALFIARMENEGIIGFSTDKSAEKNKC